jgi:hypothetical protein
VFTTACPPLAPIRSQLNPTNTIHLQFDYVTHLDSSGFPTVCSYDIPIRATRHAHLILHGLINLTIISKEHKLL